MDIALKILQTFPVRKNKKQKLAFAQFICDHAAQHGWDARVEAGGLIKSRNIVLGNIDSAELIFTAHYDTCAMMPLPNFITPKNFLYYLIYQILLCAALFVIPALIGSLVSLFLPDFGRILVPLLFWGMLIQMMCGKANPHTANDNTSGTAVIAEMIARLNPRGKTALVLFDNEELGLLGSSAFYEKHKKQLKNTFIVNLDCVSDGDHLLFTAKRKAKKHPFFAPFESIFAQHAAKCDKTPVFGSAFYPSDQANFPLGSAVCALKKKPVIGLYMDRIHTPRDTVFDESNLYCLIEILAHFAQIAEK